MSRLVAAEFVKLFTTRVWLWLLLGCLALTALFASLDLAFTDTAYTTSRPLSSAAGQRSLFGVGGGTGALVAVLAAIGITGEFRHKTVGATFLSMPRRSRVVAAKLLIYALVGTGYGAACFAVTTAIALPWLDAKHIHVTLTSDRLPAVLAGVMFAMAIYGVVGVGLGALLREQVATAVTLLVSLYVVEPILTNSGALGGWTMYLPGAATDALAQFSQTGHESLHAWQGALVLTGYGLIFAAAGILLTMRRDVT
jgi:hypothetical protein